jgi:hypothetical protein
LQPPVVFFIIVPVQHKNEQKANYTQNNYGYQAAVKPDYATKNNDAGSVPEGLITAPVYEALIIVFEIGLHPIGIYFCFG